MISRQADEKGIQRVTQIDPEMTTIRMDPDRLQQILLNLYLNSVDAMEHGGILTVSVARDSQRPDRIAFRISDTGIGIGKEDLAKIFDPYFTTKSSGTGLGLAVVHNVVEALGGEIRVESAQQKGTCVTVVIPEQAEE